MTAKADLAQEPATRSPAATARSTPASIDSRQLFLQGNTLLIEHCGQRYTLRVTRENKLILTK